MKMRFDGKVVLVTGAATGIGEGIAKLFATEGASVLVVDVNPAVAGVADAIANQGGHAASAVTDVGEAAAVSAAVDLAVETFGALDILINNVGIQDGKSIEDVTLEEWDRTLTVNLRSVYLFMHAAIPHLKVRAPGSSVVNISSIHAGNTLPATSSYAASKAGMLGLVRSSALDLASYGIRVNSVAPGTIATGMFFQWVNAQPDPDAAMAKMLSFQPTGRVGTPEDIAESVAFLASEKASYITGQTLWVDGGQSIRAFMP